VRQNNVTDSLDARAEAQRAEQLRANERVRQRALEEKRKAESEVGA
jgi:hypothetical protein